MNPLVYHIDAGTLPYSAAWRMQERIQQGIIAEKRIKEHRKGSPAGWLIFVEHPHVYTIGKSGKAENLLFSDEIMKKRGIELVKTDRGGDITYHGPGQLVGYPVLDLDCFGIGVATYIERLEEVIIRVAARHDIKAARVPARTGVWVGNNKLCALGIKCSRYVTMHGFALNIHTDLDFFHGIVPCGISDGGVTSFEKLLKKAPSKDQIAGEIVTEFENLFQCRMQAQTIPADYAK